MKISKPNSKYNISVIDNIFDSNFMLVAYDTLVSSPYYYKNKDVMYDNTSTPKLRSDFYINNQLSELSISQKLTIDTIYDKIKYIFQELKVPKELTHLQEIYSNMSSPGTVDMFHVDSPEPSSLTVLYYANPKWEIDFVGETIFTNNSGDEIIASVTPKPGRIVIFEGSIGHSARPPQIIKLPRVTLAYKFIKTHNNK